MNMTNQRTHPSPDTGDRALWEAILSQFSEKERSFFFPSEANALPDGNVQVSGKVSTNGWDTVCAVRAEDLNRAIEKKKTYPANVNYQYTEEGASASITGDFGPWAISPGGDGSNVNIRIPFQSGSFSYEGITYSLQGGEAIAQVKLAYFPEALKTPKPGNYDLKVSTTSKDRRVPVVSIIQYENETHKIPTLMAGVFSAVLCDWLLKNLAKFDAIFSTVTLEPLAENKDFKWLKSTSMSYAYTDTGSLASSVFGVLCMTNQHSSVSLPRQIDGACLQEEKTACFVIKKELFAKYQFLPSLPFAFDGATSSDFTINETGNGISAKNLKLSKIEYGTSDYYPTVESFDVSFDQSYIFTKTNVRTNISPGIDSIVTILTYQTLTLGKKDNKQYLEYVTIRDPEVIKTTEVSAGVIVTEVIAGIILAIVGTVAAQVIKKVVWKILVCILIAIVSAMISVIIHQIIERCMGGDIGDEIPSISPMVTMATKQILWPMCDPANPNYFTLKQVFYNDSFVLCGNPVYLF